MIDVGQGDYVDMVEFYTMKNVFYLPEVARWSFIKKHAKQNDFAVKIDKLLSLAKEVKKVVDDKARFTDWNERDDIKAELKVELILLLAKHKYPPVDRDEVYNEIIEQTENFKKYQGAK